MDFPPTDEQWTLREAFDELGSAIYGGDWDRKEAEAHKRSSPNRAKAKLESLCKRIEEIKKFGYSIEEKAFRDYTVRDFDPRPGESNYKFTRDESIDEKLNAIRHLISETCLWPDPDSREYQIECQRYMRRETAEGDLDSILQSGKVGMWLYRTKGEPREIKHYEWNQAHCSLWKNVAAGTGGFSTNDFGVIALHKPDLTKVLSGLPVRRKVGTLQNNSLTRLMRETFNELRESPESKPTNNDVLARLRKQINLTDVKYCIQEMRKEVIHWEDDKGKSRTNSYNSFYKIMTKIRKEYQ